MNHSVTRLTTLSLLVLLGLSLVSCTGNVPPGPNGGNPQQVAPTSTPIPTAPSVARRTYIVQRGDVQNIYDATGRWQPRDQTQLSFAIAGTMRRVQVKRGDTVQKGQLLADFQIGTLEDQLASAKLSLQTAQENLQSGSTGTVATIANAEIALANAKLNYVKAQQGSPWPQVESAKISLDNANQNLLNATRSYNDAVSRANNPGSAIDAAYNSLVSAQSGVRSAQASYDSAAQSWSQYQFQISSAQNSVIQAQLSLLQAQTSVADPTKQQAVDSAQLNVNQIQNNINQSTLYAPDSGEVLEVDIKPGDAVKAFDQVIVIGRPEPKEVVASLAIGDAQKLAIGMVGVCQVVNRPETAVQWVVRRIPISSRDSDQTTRIAASLEGLTTDQLVEFKMPLQVSHNVLWLPPAAVRTFQNRTFVVLQTPDGQKAVDVTLGLVTTDRDEIKDGVKEGDIVVGP